MSTPWSDEQRRANALQMQRIGWKAGELWAAPPEHWTPARILQVMARVPDGAGHTGWPDVLARETAEERL